MNKKLNYLLLVVFSFFSSQSVLAAKSVSAAWVGSAFDNRPCQGRKAKYGPYDYLLRHEREAARMLRINEENHFNPEVEHLIKGQTSLSPLGDIAFVLSIWPNHHRALHSVIRHRINNWPKHDYRFIPAECYLQRAVNFSPKDATAHMLYAMLLHSTNHQKQALTQYRKALEAEPNHVQARYNLGLLLVELEEYEEANEIAHNLYSRGYPLPGLKNKLIDANAWQN